MPPKSKARKRSENAYQSSAYVQKQQRLSFESTESIATAVEVASTSGASLGDVRSSAVSAGAATEIPNLSTGPSELTTPAGLSTAGVSFEERTEGAGRAGKDEMLCRSLETESTMEESVETDIARVTADDPMTSRTSQEILGKYVDEWLQVLGKEEVKSVAMFLCFHLVSTFSFTETKAAEYAATMLNKNERTV